MLTNEHHHLIKESTMLKVSEILKVKGDFLYTTSPDTLVDKAVAPTSEQTIGSLVIMQHGELVGTLTCPEAIRHTHLPTGQAGDYTPRSIMPDPPASVTPN